jgi:hypothetical protein
VLDLSFTKMREVIAKVTVENTSDILHVVRGFAQVLDLVITSLIIINEGNTSLVTNYTIYPQLVPKEKLTIIHKV